MEVIDTHPVTLTFIAILLLIVVGGAITLGWQFWQVCRDDVLRWWAHVRAKGMVERDVTGGTLGDLLQNWCGNKNVTLIWVSVPKPTPNNLVAFLSEYTLLHDDPDNTCQVILEVINHQPFNPDEKLEIFERIIDYLKQKYIGPLTQRNLAVLEAHRNVDHFCNGDTSTEQVSS